MQAYEKAISHFCNHRKDKFFQQCAPLITTSTGKKDDFCVLIDGESFLVTAYCMKNALEIARDWNPKAEIKPGRCNA